MKTCVFIPAWNVRGDVLGVLERLPAAFGRSCAEVFVLDNASSDGTPDAVLARLRPEELGERRQVQGRDVTVLDAVYQVVQHFALHLGQIILVAKAQVPGAVRFYEDAGGLAKPIWKQQGSKR